MCFFDIGHADGTIGKFDVFGRTYEEVLTLASQINDLAFDGVFIWAGLDDGKLRAVNASTGELGPEFFHPFYSRFPITSIAFDGLYTWAGNGDTGIAQLFGVNSNTGALARSNTTLDGGPITDVVFDGFHIWTGHMDGNVNIVDASTGVLIDRLLINHVDQESNPVPITALVFDGVNIWAGYEDGTLNVVDAISETVTVISEDDLAGGPISALVFDGAHVWAADNFNDRITKFNSTDLSQVAAYSTGSNPTGLSFDSADVWVLMKGENSVMKR